VTLSLLWLGISGVYKPLLLALGAGSVLFVVWMSRRMEVVGVEHTRSCIPGACRSTGSGC